MRGILKRNLTKTECSWLDDELPAGKEVFSYDDETFGCIGSTGIAVTLKENLFTVRDLFNKSINQNNSLPWNPFIQIPKDSVEWIN